MLGIYTLSSDVMLCMCVCFFDQTVLACLRNFWWFPLVWKEIIVLYIEVVEFVLDGSLSSSI